MVDISSVIVGLDLESEITISNRYKSSDGGITLDLDIVTDCEPGSSMIRNEFPTDKTTKDDLNVMMSSVDEKEKNLAKESQQSILNTKAEQYNQIHCSYCSWKTEVDLGPPFSDCPVPAEDGCIRSYYNALQYTLYETGFPETEDRTKCLSMNNGKDRVTVAVLSSPLECIGMLLEGGKQCPGDMLLIMSCSWLKKKKSVQKNGLYSLFVHKAITFESGGRSFLEVFDPPRRVTYFINYFTRSCTDGSRDDGEELELDLDCPMSSSLTLARMVDDKLWTRIMMDEVGMEFPETLAFNFCTTLPYDSYGNKVKIVFLDTKIGMDNLIFEEIQKFVNSAMMLKHEKIVVKPSGAMWHGSAGVTYHQRSDPLSIWKAALQLLNDLEEEDIIMVEAFIDSIHPKKGGLKWGSSEKHAARIRATVCRGPFNKAHTSKIVCGIGLKKDPVNGDNTIPQTFDTTMLAMGVTDKSVRQRLEQMLKLQSEKLLQHIMSYEVKMSHNERGGFGAQTDLIGIDYILTEINGVLTPVGIEVNSHDCTINCHMAEFICPEQQGEAFQPFVQNIIARSQRFVMRGKTVLVIGAGGYSKKFIWPAAKEFGIEVVLVDNNPEHFAASLVSQFITYDLTDHTQDDVHARNIIQILVEKNITIDGCVTFWEDCGPLAAHIGDLLDLSGPSLQGALTVKKKSKTQQTLFSRKAEIPHWPRAHLYASKSYHIGQVKDIDEAAAKMDFPCVMKLEYGSSAVGVVMVEDLVQCHYEWNIIQEELQGENSHPGIGLGHGNTMMLMDYIEGTEHDVDIIIYKRKLIAAFASDNGPTRLPKFTETSCAMPSFLPDDKQRQLVVAAYQCCVESGLVSGVFNVEMKMTPIGPKLLEINARMAGFYYRDWIQTLYNVDILLCSFMIACNVKPLLHDVKPVGQLIGAMTVASAHRKPLSDPSIIRLIQLLEDNGVIRVNRLEAELPPPSEDKYEEPFWNIAVLDEDPEIAKTKLIGVFSLLGLNTREYPVDEYLKDFKKS